MLNSFLGKALKCWITLTTAATPQAKTAPRSNPVPASPPRLSQIPLSSLLPWALAPLHSQGLEAGEASEHAPMHVLQLVGCQQQLLHAGCSVKGALAHLLDLIVAQVSKRDRTTGENQGEQRVGVQGGEPVG